MNTEIVALPISAIAEVNRLRPVDLVNVNQLAISIAERGLINPISVRPEAEGYVLISGSHRLAVAVMLDWDTISAVIHDIGEDEARLQEIDENLYRHELNAFDQAAFMAERREIYERINGKLKSGPKKNNKNKDEAIDADSAQIDFYGLTAEKFGLARRTVQEAITRWGRIRPEVRQALRGSEWAKIGTNLDKVARMAADDQLELFDLVTRNGVQWSDAVRQLTAVDGTQDVEEVLFGRFLKLWSKSSPALRGRIAKHANRGATQRSAA